MLPGRLSALPDCSLRVSLVGAATALVLGGSVPALAQQGAAPGVETAIEPVQTPEPGDDEEQGFPLIDDSILAAQDADGTPREIAFEASELRYDQDTDTITAAGDVILRSGDQSVLADAVTRFNPDIPVPTFASTPNLSGTYPTRILV